MKQEPSLSTPQLINQLYAENYSKQVAGIRRKGLSEYDAEDVVMEAYARALQYYRTYKAGKGEIAQWFSTILYNCFYDFHHQDTIDSDENEDWLLDDKTPVDIYDKQMVQREVDKQPQLARDILQKCLIEGITSKDAALIFPLSDGSIRNLLTKFRNEMREKYHDNLLHQ